MYSASLSCFYVMWNQLKDVMTTKRRWLPHLRRPSQGKGEKTPSGAQSPAATADKPAPLKKVLSDKKIKLPYAGDNGRASDDVFENSHGAQAALDEAEDDAAELELPPPMKPIQDPQTVLQQAPTPTAAASVAPTREQHGGTASGPARSDTAEEEEPGTPGAEGVEAALRKREYVLKELVDTEEVYVSDLKLVCDGYLRHLQDPNADPPLPEGLRDRRHRMIFGNIEAIYEWHRDIFLRDLRACLTAPELLGPLFRKFLEKRLFMYEAYCRNKPVSEYIVSEHEQYFQELRQKLGHKLQLGDLLIKPIQRIQKYHLLVPKILTYSENANAPPNVIAALRDAVLCTSIIPKNANDMMDVGRLQGFTGNITSQGKLLLQEPLICADVSNGGSGEKGKELHVFLFEQCMIFSEAVGKKTQFTSPTYNYKAHIQLNKMQLEELEGNAGFIIHSSDPNKPKLSYLCRAPEARRQQWISTLSSILQSQRIFGEALENPGAYLRELTCEPTRDPAADGWCGLRKTESVPPSLASRMVPELRGRQQRPHTKANTINLPTNAGRAEERKNLLSPTSPPNTNGLAKRPWGLKLRRGGGGPVSGEPGEGSLTELRPPELTSPVADVMVPPGVSATLSCRVIALRATASWRKTAPETRALRHGGRFVIKYSADGVASLTIHACRPSDAGVYCCLVSNEVGGVQSSARLSVSAGGASGVPVVRAHPAGGFVVQWDEPAPAHLEYCRVGEGEWRRATDAPVAANTVVLEELPAGQYSFRVICARSGVPGAASPPAACGGGGGWQREQFARRYAAEEEIGRGRTARVLAGRDTGTGHRVALKQVVSGRGADASREFRALSRAAHPGLVRALALFPEVPRPGFHTLVLELVNGPTLLEWASQEQLTQAMVATHTRQLLAALDALHSANVAHLDVRPENILVDLNGSQPQLKLIDLGSAVEVGVGSGPTSGEVLPPAPAQLEFAPPECVLGRPPTPAWDAWAAGVFLYVFLTGLSPFLDESIEETTANIIKCDYCFPSEHWDSIDERPQKLIRGLLDATPSHRMTPKQAMADSWFQEPPETPLSVAQLKTFLERRRPAGHSGAFSYVRSPVDT